VFYSVDRPAWISCLEHETNAATRRRIEREACYPVVVVPRGGFLVALSRRIFQTRSISSGAASPRSGEPSLSLVANRARSCIATKMRLRSGERVLRSDPVRSGKPQRSPGRIAVPRIKRHGRRAHPRLAGIPRARQAARARGEAVAERRSI